MHPVAVGDEIQRLLTIYLVNGLLEHDLHESRGACQYLWPTSSGSMPLRMCSRLPRVHLQMAAIV